MASEVKTYNANDFFKGVKRMKNFSVTLTGSYTKDTLPDGFEFDEFGRAFKRVVDGKVVTGKNRQKEGAQP